MQYQPQAKEQALARPGVPGDSEESLLRLQDVLRIVQVGRSAWYDLVKAGLAPQSVKIGSSAFWVRSELQLFIAERIRLSRTTGTAKELTGGRCPTRSFEERNPT